MDLTNRIAKCDCGMEMPSSTDLAFFEYRGEGSYIATHSCKVCRYQDLAHARAANDPAATHLRHILGHDFEPLGGLDVDIFYCGCRGWD